MSEKIVQLNEEVIKGQLKELVRGSVEETLNELLEAEAEKLTQAARYERNEQRQGYRSGHYSRNLITTSGDVTLKVARVNTDLFGQLPAGHFHSFTRLLNICSEGFKSRAIFYIRHITSPYYILLFIECAGNDVICTFSSFYNSKT